MNRHTPRATGRFLTSSIVAALLAIAAAPPADAQVNWSPVADGYPRTAAEQNGFTAHTRHDEMWQYLEAASLLFYVDAPQE